MTSRSLTAGGDGTTLPPSLIFGRRLRRQPAAGGAAQTVVLLTSVILNVVPLGSLPVRVGAVIYIGLGMLTLGRCMIFRAQRRLLALVLAVTVSGPLLALLTSGLSVGRPFFAYFALTQILEMTAAGGVVLQTLGLVERYGPRAGTIAIVMPILAVPLSNSSLITANAWKFWLAWPVSVIALLLAGRRSWLVCVLGACLLVLGLLNDLRSAAAITFAALMLYVLAGKRPVVHLVRRRRSSLARAAFGVTTTALVYGVVVALAAGFQSLAVQGVLGEEIRGKQIAQSGSNIDIVALLVGARAEIPATFSLARDSPAGYGVGIIPSDKQVFDAQQAYVAGVANNVTLDQSSPEGVVSTNSVQLHSVTADLWYGWGLVGLAVATSGFVLSAMGFLRALRGGFAPNVKAAFLLLMTWLPFDLLFSPLRGNWYMVGVALAAGLVVMGTRRRATDW